ncbi:hypothetical protein R5R35_001733 [Gryllus longicercus]|uniref:Peroxidase n=3 Tax=Gryllus longicercus TaxID=2509291 RepID=A0AAN9WGZ7_9ORTH
MALMDNKIRRSLHCDKKECAQNLKQSIKVYDSLKSTTMDLMKAKTKAELVLTANDIVKKPIPVLPGSLKMAITTTVLGIILWTSLQFGAQIGNSPHEVQAFSMFRLPVSLQSFVGWYAPRAHAAEQRPGLVQLRDIEEKIASSLRFGTDSVDRMSRMEQNLVSSGVNVREGTPMHGQLIASYPTNEALGHGRDAHIALKASMHLSHSVCYLNDFSSDECARFLTMLKLPKLSDSGESSEKQQQQLLGDKCAAQHSATLTCSRSTKYRSANGSCNHLTHPSWGQSLTGYRRLLFPQYSDGIQEPRMFSIGMPKNKQNLLPSARVVSTKMAANADLPDNVKTLALMQWTQFVEHDLTHTPINKMFNNFDSSIMCCDHEGQDLMPRHTHPACMPIEVPQNDPFYSRRHMTCMNYVRSVTAMRPDCSFGPAEQMNQVSHYLDGSMIYGSTEEKSRSLRTFSHGHLKHDRKNGQMFLPASSQPSKHCQLSPESQACYESGDLRVNGHPHLTVMHTLWLREHNRIADKLQTLNPHWGDEKLYQEARRIVIAEIQHITFSEWLPLVLGQRYTKKSGLEVKQSGFSTEFSENVDPSVTNSFATAALRFVHSLMEGNLRLINEDREVNHTLRLNQHFNRPRVLEEPGHFDGLVRGLATQNSQKSDMTFTEDITSLLYQDSDNYGLDIISLDIQRGRDHGLPGYNQFRRMCGLQQAENFDDFSTEISQNMIRKLREMYRSVDDVDLLIGGMAEHPKDDGLLGPTFRCIIGEQFARTRKGDRYFYDLKNQPSSFTAEQLQEIRKVSLSRVFCDNSDDVSSMQPQVFHKPSSSNSLVSCRDATSIPKADLTAWIESH